ncbi:hypothetical protein [Streptomyces flaveolus]|uniref:hypothetical protein n=1 Tax=Streptomyces flaveolus TaxID=67297 RepID=UPI003F54167F
MRAEGLAGRVVHIEPEPPLAHPDRHGVLPGRQPPPVGHADLQIARPAHDGLPNPDIAARPCIRSRARSVGALPRDTALARPPGP